MTAEEARCATAMAARSLLQCLLVLVTDVDGAEVAGSMAFKHPVVMPQATLREVSPLHPKITSALHPPAVAAAAATCAFACWPSPGLQAVAAEPSSDKDDPKPKPPTSCGDNKEKDDCLELGAQEGDCAWCKGDYMPPSCVGVDAAKWIPETVAHCKLPQGKKVTNTVTNTEGDDGGDEGADAGEKKKSKGDDSGSGGQWPSGGGDWPSGGGDWPSGGGSSGGGGDYPYGPGGGGSGGEGAGKSCKELHSRHKCMKGSKSEGACAWCEKGSMVVGEGCVSEAMIKYLPKMVADCEVGKDRRKKASVAVE
jgi:hypothetical protein